MGKIQDGDRGERSPTNVKRKVVSASAHLEVISQESFVQQQQQPQTSSKQKPSSATGKADTPLVIHLKDTLPGSLALQSRRRQSSLEEQDSDVSRSTDEDQSSSSSGSSSGGKGGGGSRRRGLRGGAVAHHAAASTLYRNSPSASLGRGRSSPDITWSHIYGDVASIPEFVPKSLYTYQPHYYHHHYYPHYPQAWPLQPTHYHPAHVVSPLATSELLPHEKASYQRFRSSTQKVKEKSRKNLSALISVIEKAHRKEPAQDIEPNLSQNSAADAKLSGSILNNASSAASPSRSLHDAEVKRRNMAECDNVELICNDLSAATTSAAPRPAMDHEEDPQDGDRSAMSESPCTTTDESDQSDKASVASSSDTLSEDLAGELLPALDGGEMTPRELQQLAQYTTGVPLLRYDVPAPHHHHHHHHHPACPQCAAWYAHSQTFQGGACFSEEAFNQHSLFHQPQHELLRSQFRHKSSASTPRTSISSDSDVSSDIEDSSSTSSSESSAASSGTDQANVSAQDSPSALNGSTSDAYTIKHGCVSSNSSKPSPSSNQPFVKVVSRNPHSKIVSANASISTTSSTSGTVTVASSKDHSGLKGTSVGYRLPHPARQLWDIDVWPASRRRAARHYPSPYHHPHYQHMEHFYGGPPFSDSVYMDLTGLDVTVEVTYHNRPGHYSQVFSHSRGAADSQGSDYGAEKSPRYPDHDTGGRLKEATVGGSASWPYPVHSLFQALYSPTVTAPVQGIQLPLRFNNTVFYPLKAYTSPPVQLKKYEMSIPPLRPWIRIGGPDKDVPSDFLLFGSSLGAPQVLPGALLGCSLGAPRVLSGRSSGALWVHLNRSLDAPWALLGCSLGAPQVLFGCSLIAPRMLLGCSSGAPRCPELMTAFDIDYRKHCSHALLSEGTGLPRVLPFTGTSSTSTLSARHGRISSGLHSHIDPSNVYR
ncbi:hypothetical protein RRG08_064555 [Elysia crispata]|uniref:Uncharacterized protein n=1 Tax=Elysia crispata TaxID=231223 RepID=A0AAE1EC09_9GAST|nr:hypothetical protein RRG08_064555 [Elysia crispata]